MGRWSAAGGESIIERRQGRGIARAGTEQSEQNQQGGDDRDIRRAHLPLGKQTDQAEVVAAGGVVMKRLMERVADRECPGNEQEKRQQTRERWLRHPS